jgi:cephalosporin-C deacetylase-like acetyl esterase
MVYDTLRATDYVVSRPDVDVNRVATMGMSMGSTMAGWHAALDERVRVCVDMCCLTDFQALIETRNPGRPQSLLLRSGPAETLHDRGDQ